jgi:hypothetical protein
MPAKKRKKPAAAKPPAAEPTHQTTQSERHAEPPLPTAEWLAEMATRVWNVEPQSHSIKHRGVDYGWMEAAEKAFAAYRASHLLLHRIKLQREVRAELDKLRQEIEAQLAPDDTLFDMVEYHLACKLITGEARRDRAEERFTKLTHWLYSQGFWEDEDSGAYEPPPDYRQQKQMSVGEAAQFKRQYARMKKIPKNKLAETLDMIGYAPGQRQQKAGQKSAKS